MSWKIGTLNSMCLMRLLNRHMYKKACHSKWYFQNTPLTLIILVTLEFLKMLLLWRMLVVKHTASMEEKCATFITHKRLIKIETEQYYKLPEDEECCPALQTGSCLLYQVLPRHIFQEEINCLC